MNPNEIDSFKCRTTVDPVTGKTYPICPYGCGDRGVFVGEGDVWMCPCGCKALFRWRINERPVKRSKGMNYPLEKKRSKDKYGNTTEEFARELDVLPDDEINA